VSVVVPAECVFYHSMELPGIGLIEGSWDHRGTADDYLGHVDFRGKRALDVGPANGFFSFEMERRGAEVTALDLGSEADWDDVPHPYLEPGPVRANLRENVRQVENAFWFAHRALGSKVKLVHGSAYDTPALGQPVDIALMGNVLQHLRDPFRAIERVAQVVTDTLIITEAIWDTDESFVGTPGMRLMPNADTPYCNHSWWQVSPALVIEILRLLGFPQLSFQYHQQRFLASATDTQARWVRHFTVTGTRPRRLREKVVAGSDFRIVFPADAWKAEAQGAVHRRRWWSDRRAIISIENLDSHARVVSIACGLASPHHDRVELRLNGSTVWRGKVFAAPTPIFTMAATLRPGANTLEVRAENAPNRTPRNPHPVGFAVYDIALSTARPHDVSDLGAMLREPDADRARLRGDVERLTALLRESEADRAARLDQVHELSGRLQKAEADRAARLDQVEDLSRLLQQAEADRAARLDQVHELSGRLQQAEADRVARLDQVHELARLLQHAEADRAARLDQVHELARLLQESQADRAARLDQVHALTRRLRQAEADRAARLDRVHWPSRLLRQSGADRAARLDQVRELSRLLQQAEAGRAVRLEVIQDLQAELAGLQARLEEIDQTQTPGDVHGRALDVSAG
jgi:hypothetical protein